MYCHKTFIFQFLSIGIGNTTVECEQLIRETESFARNLMAREERVAQFGVLSQDMVNSHPLSAKVSDVSFSLLSKGSLNSLD